MSGAQVTADELLLKAAGHVAHGAGLVVAEPFADRAQAERVLAAHGETWRGLLDVLSAMLGDRRRIARMGSRTDRRELAALALYAELAASREDRPGQGTPSGIEGAWRDAGRSLRGAADLIRTHTPATGIPRTPQAQWVDLNVDGRSAGYAVLGETARLTADTATLLRVRLAEVDTRRRGLVTRLPDMLELTTAADGVAWFCRPDTAPVHSVLDLGTARLPVRSTSPAEVVLERAARVRMHAWEHRGDPTQSVATLGNYAALAVIVHHHTAGMLGESPEHDPAATATTITAHRDAAAAWKRVHHELGTMRTTAPGDPVVANDVRAIQTTLRASADPPTSALDKRETLAALASTADGLPELGHWGGQTLTAIVANRRLLMPAQALDRDSVSEDPDFAAARLAGQHIRTPGRVADRLEATWGHATQGSGGLLRSAGSQTPRRARRGQRRDFQLA